MVTSLRDMAGKTLGGTLFLMNGNRARSIGYPILSLFPWTEHVDTRNATAWSLDHDKQGDRKLRD